MSDWNAQDQERGVALSSALQLMLSNVGLRIPGLDTVAGRQRHKPVPLDLAALALVAELSRGPVEPTAAVDAVASRLDARREPLVDLVGMLADRRVLSPAAREVPVDPVHAGDSQEVSETAVYTIPLPRLFRIADGRFEHVDHEGRVRARLDVHEMSAASEFRAATTPAEALAAHRATCGSQALTPDRFDDVVRRLRTSGLLIQLASTANEFQDRREGRPTVGGERATSRDRKRFQRLNDTIRQDVAESLEREQLRVRQTGVRRIPVVSVQQFGTIMPLALGMIVAYAQAWRDGSLNHRYRFHPDWLIRPNKVRAIVADGPGIFLFSNYNWSHQHNRNISAKVKAVSPSSITVHGGPNTPAYAVDTEAYFRANPHVDVCVRGEGEVAVSEILEVLTDQWDRGTIDRSVLAGIAGISYRDGERIVRTADRPRVRDLDELPSPILGGLFEAYGDTPLAIIETNRGCPFKCAFCDWGSATNTKVRKFSLDRIFAELEWLAEHQVAGVMCADANFGMYPRDVEIAQKIADLRRRTGYPRGFSASFAKNTVIHTRRIIEILNEAGVISHASIGVQSMDPATLETVQRKNIKIESFDELATEFNEAGLPLWVDMMVGLPGQTLDSFKNDLQGCVNRGVFPRTFMTELLANSPMNEPGFREHHQIKTELSPDGRRNLVVSTATFTREEFFEMDRLRMVFVICDTIGMLRQLAHFVRSETGLREIDFYHRVLQAIREEPERWPTIAFAVRAVPGLLVPPTSWALAIDEAGRFTREILGLPDSEALRTALAVQRAVLPSRGRELPITLELPHDYATWHAQMVAAQKAGFHDDWQDRVPRLGELGPGTFSVEDPDLLCQFGIGSAIDGDLFGNFELRSPIARWRRAEPRAPTPPQDVTAPRGHLLV